MNWAQIIAAIIALVGGLAFYRWQRKIDRETQSLVERRAAYKSYIEVALSAETHLFDTQGDTENSRVSDYQAALAVLQISGPDNVVIAALKHRDALHALQDALDSDRRSDDDQIEKIQFSHRNVMAALASLLREMRVDNFKTAAISDKIDFKLLEVPPADGQGTAIDRGRNERRVGANAAS